MTPDVTQITRDNSTARMFETVVSAMVFITMGGPLAVVLARFSRRRFRARSEAFDATIACIEGRLVRLERAICSTLPTTDAAAEAIQAQLAGLDSSVHACGAGIGLCEPRCDAST